MNKIPLMLLGLLLLSPLSRAEEGLPSPESAPAEESTAWARLTRWLRPRPNPHRTSVSDIIVRGRRSMFVMPPMAQKVQAPAQENRVMTENEARRFMKAVERDFAELKVLLDGKKYMDVVEKARLIITNLEDKQVGPEQILRKQELLAQTRAYAADAREKVETQGVRDVIDQLQRMEGAFRSADFTTLRDIAAKIEGFVTTWTFTRVENRNVAQAKLASCREFIRRAAVREEFAALPLKLNFTVVSETGPSTAVINNRSVREGDALSEHLMLKKIRKGQMTFVYKGEEIVYDFE